LIVVGVLLLLDNLGMLPGDFWINLWHLWPMIFIALGLDSLWRRQGLAGATLLIGLGVVFLLSNFGYLPLSAWQVLLNLWPLLLIAVGFDILVGRRSRLAGAIGLVLILVLLAGSLWLIGPWAGSAQAAQRRPIRQDLNGAQQAQVIIGPGVGTLKLKDMLEPVALVMGTIPAEDVLRVSQSFDLQGDQAVYSLQAIGGNYTFPGAADIFTWDLTLTTEIPVDLDLELGVGDMALELTELDLSALRLDLGVGQATISLPAAGQLDGTIDAAIGQLVILVPPGVGLRVQKDTALVVVQFPPDYRQAEGVYTSPNYATADERIDLRIDMAIGQIVIREQ
jgi:hypothetical protein